MERRSLVVGLACAGLVMASRANAAGDDIADKILNAPDPTRFQVNGLPGKPEVRKDPAVQGGHAIRVHVPGKSAHPWDIAVGVPLTKPIKAGDKLLLAFWARLVDGENGADAAELPYNAVQQSSAPYATVIGGPVTIGKEWKLYSVNGVAAAAYKVGEAGVSIQLATAKQTIDVGPVFVLDLGPA